MSQVRTDNEINNIVDEVFALYEKYGANDYIGEPVSQLEHMAQSAQLAEEEGFDDDVIIAAFLHDIGHFCAPRDASEDMGGYGTMRHERVGADWLRERGFSEKVAKLIEYHVEAKRFLTFKNPKYYEKLSEASKKTLEYQGGRMTAEEADAFSKDSLFATSIRMRYWDEEAKLENQPLPDLNVYKQKCVDHLRRQRDGVPQRLELPELSLTGEQLAFWEANGYIHLKGFFNEEQREALRSWVSDLEERPETPGKWMKYFEVRDDDSGQKMLCRIEDILPYHEGFDELLRGDVMMSIVSQLMYEQATLFKEKINLKLPGGKGFGAHQDAPAFTSFQQTYHITLMISVDPSNLQNGCLEMVPGRHKEGLLPMKDDGTLAASFEESVTWEPLPTEAGDIVLFDSFIPHRSGPNVSGHPRRALYVTYNRASEGSHREAYFAEKRKVFPPECERIPGKDYSNTGVFNIGNPVNTKN